VVDAIAGAIYVIGGVAGGGSTIYNDVWASTDGGARAGLGRGGALGGYYRGTKGTAEVLQGVLGGSRSYLGEYCRCTKGY
jgi:hypothetical protein